MCTSASPVHSLAWEARPHSRSPGCFFSTDRKRGQRKGATSKNVKNRQKVSKIFSTLFDIFRAGQKTSKIVKKCQKSLRHFSRGTSFPALLGGSDFYCVKTHPRTFPELNWEVSLEAGHRHLVVPCRAILRYYRCDTPYRAILFKGGEDSPKMVRYPPLGT